MCEKRYQARGTRLGWTITDHEKNQVVVYDLDVQGDALFLVNLLNQQADELREAQAEAASLRETLIATHQWIGGSVGNEPFEVQGSGKAWSAIIRVLENTTAGADLLAELEQLQGYRAFVHSCIKSGEVCVYTFEEYLEKMKSE